MEKLEYSYSNPTILIEIDRATHANAEIPKRSRLSTSSVSLVNIATNFPFASNTAIIIGIKNDNIKIPAVIP